VDKKSLKQRLGVAKQDTKEANSKAWKVQDHFRKLQDEQQWKPSEADLGTSCDKCRKYNNGK
jgi:hypothetical protein